MAHRKTKRLAPSSISLYEREWHLLEELAARAGRTRNNYIRQVLVQHVQQSKII